jgi:hypothetical protein
MHQTTTLLFLKNPQNELDIAATDWYARKKKGPKKKKEKKQKAKEKENIVSRSSIYEAIFSTYPL